MKFNLSKMACVIKKQHIIRQNKGIRFFVAFCIGAKFAGVAN